MRVWAKVVKEQPVKYISHLDFQRTMHRAVRRACIPVEYSQGFNPHARIAFASALAVGVTSQGEYMDMLLRERTDLMLLKTNLNEKLPRGIRIIDLKEVETNCPSLSAIVNTAVYSIKARCDSELRIDEINTGITGFLRRQGIEILKKTKKGFKNIDIRSYINSITCERIDDNKVLLHMVLGTGSEGSVKPEHVITALNNYTDINFYEQVMNIHRVGLFVGRGERLFTPLETTC